MPQNSPIKIVGIIVNTTIEYAVRSLLKLIKFLNNRNVTCFLETGALDALRATGKTFDYSFLSEVSIDDFCINRNIDVIISLGGDGTVLRAARHTIKIPLLPLNAGRRGFLSEIEANSFAEELNMILKGAYFIESHARLQIKTNNQAKLPSVLNEYLITPSEPLRATSFDLHLGGEESIGIFDADGLIISTPIGSSGHALSSGGPFIHHELEAMQLSWICPISRSARPIVFPNDQIVTIKAESPGSPKIKVICDGQIFGEFNSPLELKISRSAEKTQFIRFKPFFHRKKTTKFLQ